MPSTAYALQRFLVASLFIAPCAFSSSLFAQQTYRCGNTYSQTPCADGKAIEVQDKRTDEQKTQADRTTHDSDKAAKKLTAERKSRESGEEAQLRRDKAQQMADTEKKKVHRAPFTPFFGKKQKPEKTAQAPKPPKPAKPAKPAKPPKPAKAAAAAQR